MYLQKSFPIQWVVFLFCWWFPLLYKNFLVWCSSICLFCLLFPLPKEIYQKKCYLKMKIDKFLRNTVYWDWTWRNRRVWINLKLVRRIESVIQDLPAKESPGPDNFTDQLYQILKTNQSFLNFSNNWRGRNASELIL